VAYTRTRDWATVDYYATLGVESDATDDEVARAYRLLAKQLHPDAGAPVEVAEQFKEVTVAYEVLSNHRARRDYDAVRSGLLPRPRQPYSDSPVASTGPGPRFRAAKRGTGWTMRRAWLAIVGGLVVTIIGLLAVVFTLTLQSHDAARRSGRIAVTATRTSTTDNRITFKTQNGVQISTLAPPTVNPGIPGAHVQVLYDPRHPADVIANESLVARDITLWLVAAKLLVGGPIFFVLGLRARNRLRRKRPASRIAVAGRG
jgi:hypothetical protein